MKKFLLYSIYTLVFVYAASAQNDCELMLESANIYIANKEYTKASCMLGLVIRDCGENYGGASLLLNECNRLIKDAQKTEQEPLSQHLVESKVQQPITVSKPQAEARGKAYLSIKKASFYIADNKHEIIKELDNSVYASDICFIQPKIIYEGYVENHVSLYYKIIRPNGELIQTSNSPRGYTGEEKLGIKTGSNTYMLSKQIGNKDGRYYDGGKYCFEVYYRGEKIYSTYFELRIKENALSKGDWKKLLDQCCRKSTQSFSDGKYKGETVYSQNGDERNGLGIYRWDNGQYYIGEFSSNKRDGKGISIPSTDKVVPNCQDCKFYVGSFYYNKKSGTGRCYDRLGNLIYEGSFDRDKPKDTYPSKVNNSNYKFECIEYSNGDCYVGETYYGKRNGVGLYMWSNGDLWYGEWSGDTRSSNGIYMHYDGTINNGKLGIIK